MPVLTVLGETPQLQCVDTSCAFWPHNHVCVVSFRLRDQFLQLRERDPVSNQYASETIAKEAEVARKVVQVRMTSLRDTALRLS